MPRVEFATLPDHARVWVFAGERTLAPAEREALVAAVTAFLDNWVAHGRPLTCGYDLRHDRFLLVAADERAAGVSGCSIDALTRQLRELERRFEIALLDNGPVHYRDGDGVARASRPEFGALADAGTVTPDTVVFDNTVPTLGDVREGRWEAAARRTWHGRAFFGAAPAP